MKNIPLSYLYLNVAKTSREQIRHSRESGNDEKGIKTTFYETITFRLSGKKQDISNLA